MARNGRNWQNLQMAQTRIPGLLEQVISSLHEPYVLIDQDYVVRFANEAYLHLHQKGSLNGLVGKHCYEISHGYQLPCDQSGESCPLSLSRDSGATERVVHIHRHAGNDLYETIELTPLKNREGVTAYFLERIQPLHHFSPSSQHQGLTGRAPTFVAMLDQLQRVAPTETTVLIQGESGTGKELVARALHDSSKRSLKPYITVDCTGLPETLIESELFGHEKGAFTGAYALKRGLVEEADGGTLFLDEIGDIPLGLQAKLLRFLETGMYRRVGSNQVLHADVRLVSATHRILKDLVATNEFRNDLYYRVSAFPIWVPRLAERKEDLPLLVASLLKRLPKGDAFKLDKAALNLLEAYPFPGNIRELKNILERAVILCDGRLITPAHLPPEVTGFVAAAHDNVLASGNVAGRIDDIGQLLQEGFTRQEIAEKLQVSERTVYRILKALK